MKTRPELITRSGKSNVLKNLLTNLRENDLHYENSKITQCVFLGVLKLKPVPSVFSSNKLSSSKSSIVDDNTKKVKKHPIRSTNKSYSTDISKVISGKVSKKNPEKIKALVKKNPPKKSNIIKVKFRMNKKSTLVEGTNSNVPDVKSNLPDTQNQSNIVATSSRMQYNPVQNLFDKLKIKKDKNFGEQSNRNEESLLQNFNDNRRSKSPKNKSDVFELNYSASESTSVKNIQSKISHFTNESPTRIKELFAENNPTDNIVIIDRELSPIKQKERSSPRFRRVSIMEGNKSRKYKEKTISSKSLNSKQNLFTEQKTRRDSSNSKGDIIVIEDNPGFSQKNTSDDDIICLDELDTNQQNTLSECIEVSDQSDSNFSKDNSHPHDKNRSNATPNTTQESLNINSPRRCEHKEDDEVIIISTMASEPLERTSHRSSQFCKSTNQVQESTMTSVEGKSIHKNKSRRTRVVPAPIPSIFLQTPRLLRSELSQKNVKKDNQKPIKSVKLQKLNHSLHENEKESEITNQKRNKSLPTKLSSPRKHKNRAVNDKISNNDTIFVSEEIKSSNQEGKPSLKLIIRQKKKTDIMTEKQVDVDGTFQGSKSIENYLNKTNTKSCSNLNSSEEQDNENESVKKLIQDLTDDDVIEIPLDTIKTVPKMNPNISHLPSSKRDNIHVTVIDVDLETQVEEDNSFSSTKSNSSDIIHIADNDDQNLFNSSRSLRSKNSKKLPDTIKIDDTENTESSEIISKQNLLLDEKIDEVDILTNVTCDVIKTADYYKADNLPKKDESESFELMESDTNHEVITIKDDIMDIQYNEIIDINDELIEVSSSRMLRSNNKTMSTLYTENLNESNDHKRELVNNQALIENNSKNQNIQENTDLKLFSEIPVSKSGNSNNNILVKSKKNSPVRKGNQNVSNSTAVIEKDEQQSPRLLRSNNKAKVPSEEIITSETLKVAEIGNKTVNKTTLHNLSEDELNNIVICEEKLFKNEKERISISPKTSLSSESVTNEHIKKNEQLILQGPTNLLTESEIMGAKEKNCVKVLSPEQSIMKSEILQQITSNKKVEVPFENNTETSKYQASRSLRSKKSENKQIVEDIDVPKNPPISDENSTCSQIETSTNVSSSLKTTNNKSKEKGNKLFTLRSQKKNVEKPEEKSNNTNFAVISSKNISENENNEIILNDKLHTAIPATKALLKRSKKSVNRKASKTVKKLLVKDKPIKKISHKVKRNLSKGAEKNEVPVILEENKEKSPPRKPRKPSQNQTGQHTKTPKKLGKKLPKVISTKIVNKRFQKKCNTDKVSKITNYFVKNEDTLKNAVVEEESIDSVINIVDQEKNGTEKNLINEIKLPVGKDSIKEKLNIPIDENGQCNPIPKKHSTKKVSFQKTKMLTNKRKRTSRVDKNIQESVEKSSQVSFVNDENISLDADKCIKKSHGRVKKMQKMENSTSNTEINQETALQNLCDSEENEIHNNTRNVSDGAVVQGNRRTKRMQKIEEKSKRNTSQNINLSSKNEKHFNICKVEKEIDCKAFQNPLIKKKGAIERSKRSRKLQNEGDHSGENALSNENQIKNKNIQSQNIYEKKLTSSQGMQIKEGPSNQDTEYCNSQKENSGTKKHIIKTTKTGKKKEITFEDQSQNNSPKMQNNDEAIVLTCTKEKTVGQLVKKGMISKQKKKLSKKNKQKKKLSNPLDSLQIAEIVNSIQAIEISEEKKKETNVDKTSESTVDHSVNNDNSQKKDTSWIDLGPQKKKRGRPKKLDSEKLDKTETKAVKQKHNTVSITQLKTPSKNKLYEEVPNKIRKLKTNICKTKDNAEPINLANNESTRVENANIKDITKITNSSESIDMNKKKDIDTESKMLTQNDHNKADDESCIASRSPVEKQKNKPRTIGTKIHGKSSENVSLKRKHNQMSVTQLKSSVKNKSYEEVPKKVKKVMSTPQNSEDSNSTILDSIESVITGNCRTKKDTTVFDFDEDESEEPIKLQFKAKQNKDDEIGKESKQSAQCKKAKVLTEDTAPQKKSPLKSPMKQATIMEMFEKITKEQKQNLAKPLFDTPEETVTSKSKPNEEIVEANRNTSKRKSSQMPPPPSKQTKNEDYEDDEDFSDDDSRAEWIPEEYAEYKYKYSAKKLKPLIFRCKICLMTFPSYPKLLKHKNIHVQAANPYECKQCKETFKDVDDLVAHLKIHKGKHPYKCNKCSEGFWTKEEFNKHLPIHILRKVKEAPKKYQCDLCGKAFVKLCDMDRHTRVHTGEKPSVCNICGKGFQQSYNLSKHLITHLHIKPFACEICNKQFNRPDVLARHVLTHAVEKPFKCSSCPKSFIRQSQLNMHIKHEHTNKNGKQSNSTPVKKDETPKKRGRKKIKTENVEEKQAADEQVSSQKVESSLNKSQ